ncbi:hypothetical protein Patl1_23089 [Pistacia atlantica]|uniref:Uncharacterized protein n=1 Tax=Pistacia atlantica TaxID=434234 RepID=A0ACC1A2M1_9ROSI|nr:hypothetical protein Patl1_23089 [Pistacia atlantica]
MGRQRRDPHPLDAPDSITKMMGFTPTLMMTPVVSPRSRESGGPKRTVILILIIHGKLMRKMSFGFLRTSAVHFVHFMGQVIRVLENRRILRAFGWIFPAIAISLLLGTGPNAFLMALAVPLGQSLVSLAVDKVWGSASNKPKSRSRTKSRRKPFARATRNSKTSQVKQENEAGKGRGSYQSWVATDGGSYEKGGKSGPRFGGWDELDKKVGNEKAAKSSASQIENELPKHQKKGKLSRIGKMRDKPLLLRLLIAVFPFLGSWTKLLF